MPGVSEQRFNGHVAPKPRSEILAASEVESTLTHARKCCLATACRCRPLRPNASNGGRRQRMNERRNKPRACHCTRRMIYIFHKIVDGQNLHCLHACIDGSTVALHGNGRKGRCQVQRRVHQGCRGGASVGAGGSSPLPPRTSLKAKRKEEEIRERRKKKRKEEE